VICNAGVKFIEKGQAVSEWAITLNVSNPSKELELTWLAGEDKGYCLRGYFSFIGDKLLLTSWWELPSDGSLERPFCAVSPRVTLYNRKKL
jgi:hypothetical protein